MFEHKSEPLLPWGRFLRRQLWHTVVAAALIAGSLGVGMVGYHVIDNQDWIDAAYSATMILTAMGPSTSPTTSGGKVFAICYAMFSGIVFITTVTVLLTPSAHRLLHSVHADEADVKSGGRTRS